MGKNRQITHMEKFQTIHVATAPSDMGYAQRFSSRIYSVKEGNISLSEINVKGENR